jgi:hypothetical protein
MGVNLNRMIGALLEAGCQVDLVDTGECARHAWAM